MMGWWRRSALQEDLEGGGSLSPLEAELEKSPRRAGGGPSLLSLFATVCVSPMSRKTGVSSVDRDHWKGQWLWRAV